jgi:hypothetical protein
MKKNTQEKLLVGLVVWLLSCTGSLCLSIHETNETRHKPSPDFSRQISWLCCHNSVVSAFFVKMVALRKAGVIYYRKINYFLLFAS